MLQDDFFYILVEPWYAWMAAISYTAKVKSQQLKTFFDDDAEE